MVRFTGSRSQIRCLILRVLETEVSTLWGCSSAGRAPALHAGGQEFEPPHLHHAKSENDGARHGLIAQPVRAHA